METLQDMEQVRRALEAPRFLIFKHSQICPVSLRAFGEYRALLETDPGIPTAWLDVIAGRTLSQHIAAHTGIRHESPQAILIADGAAVWDASHDAITRESLAQALRSTSPS